MADRRREEVRQIQDIAVPLSGWGRPWPQCLELARNLPANHWTLVGGLMVQLHSAMAGLAITRPTADVDIVLHLEVPATTVPLVHGSLCRLGYAVQGSIDSSAPAHRYTRGAEQIDVMIADRLAPSVPKRLVGHDMFALPGGTQALQRTIHCRFLDNQGWTLISVPNILGALVLKGAAYRSDSREIRRHLDDAVVLAACVKQPLEMRRLMKGSDRSRIIGLYQALRDQTHPSWMLLDDSDRDRARMNLRILTENPQNMPSLRKPGPS